MVADSRKTVAAIGNFDGVHRGHQALLNKTIDIATESGARAGVVLFDPHPRRYFRPDAPSFLLTAREKRNALLRAHGAAEILELPFDKALASLSPEQFVTTILKNKLNLSGVLIGEDFRFGKDRAGNSDALISLASAVGIDVHIVDLVENDKGTEKFGSSAIRAALQDGNVVDAAAMLGRVWSVEGEVVEGQKLGRTLGFATANMTLGDLIEPRHGVYATRARVGDTTHAAVSNFGRRPTVGAPAPLLETHIFDFEGDIYGQIIEVSFVDYLRDEQKFDGLDALKAQIDADCRKVREILA